MRAILEQNFDELYAQVSKRVKCIKPAEQIDTFTKTMQWTTLNDIINDVFGNSRFMWMIETTDRDFVVTFVDRYKCEQTKSLIVPYFDEFVWPDYTQILNMALDELKMFEHRAAVNGFRHVDIDTYYKRVDNWFGNLLVRRSKGIPPRKHVDFKKIRRLSADDQLSKWSEERKMVYKMQHCLSKINVVAHTKIISDMIGVDFSTVRCQLTWCMHRRRTAKFEPCFISENTFDEMRPYLMSYLEEYIRILDPLIANQYDFNSNRSLKGTYERIATMLNIHRHHAVRNKVYVYWYDDQDIDKIRNLQSFLKTKLETLKQAKEM